MVTQLRAQCGNAPLMHVGIPESSNIFNTRYILARADTALRQSREKVGDLLGSDALIHTPVGLEVRDELAQIVRVGLLGIDAQAALDA